MNRRALIACLVALPVATAGVASPRATLIEARNLAYDANYRNDQAGLRSAISTMESLAASLDATSPYVHYYLWFTYWSLAGSQFQAKDFGAALESGTKSLEHARLAVAAREKDPEFQTALVNALIVVGILGKHIADAPFMAELRAVRLKALELGPTNPRVVWMDAGVIYNSPPESGGSRDRGLVRAEEAIRLLDAESEAETVDPLAPRWGGALFYGWIANMYLTASPAQKEKARAAADTALRMRPDFWWVKEQVLPQLRP